MCTFITAQETCESTGGHPLVNGNLYYVDDEAFVTSVEAQPRLPAEAARFTEEFSGGWMFNSTGSTLTIETDRQFKYLSIDMRNGPFERNGQTTQFYVAETTNPVDLGYFASDGEPYIFEANGDHEGHVTHFQFPQPIVDAQLVFHMLNWHADDEFGLFQVEIYGCREYIVLSKHYVKSRCKKSRWSDYHREQFNLQMYNVRCLFAQGVYIL